MLARTFGCARAWLGEVASVALVQACQDAGRAYRNWFDSLSGRRKGRKGGRPAFRRKHRRQSIRLTRNGFALRGERLYVAKVGNIKVAWSRALPSVPSSVTVLALGRRESLNACGGNVRPGLVPADLGETGTHRSAA